MNEKPRDNDNADRYFIYCRRTPTPDTPYTLYWPAATQSPTGIAEDYRNTIELVNNYK